MSDFVDEFSPFAQASFQELLEQLSTPGEDVAEAWPADHLQAMAATGVATWDIPTAWNGRELPPGQMLEGLSGGAVDGAAYDADLAERLPDSLY